MSQTVWVLGRMSDWLQCCSPLLTPCLKYARWRVSKAPTDSCWSSTPSGRRMGRLCQTLGQLLTPSLTTHSHSLNSLIPPLPHSLARSLARPLTHPLTQSLTQSLAHSLAHSPTRPLAHPPTHSLTHQPPGNMPLSTPLIPIVRIFHRTPPLRPPTNLSWAPGSCPHQNSCPGSQPAKIRFPEFPAQTTLPDSPPRSPHVIPFRNPFFCNIPCQTLPPVPPPPPLLSPHKSRNNSSLAADLGGPRQTRRSS